MSIKERGRKGRKWYYRVGYSYSGLKNYEESNKFLRRAIEINPEYPWPYFELGWNLKKLGKNEEALKYFKDVRVSNKMI